MTDTHTSHCCSAHGCKYNDDHCTVMTGLAPQEGPCEECELEDDSIMKPLYNYAKKDASYEVSLAGDLDMAALIHEADKQKTADVRMDADEGLLTEARNFLEAFVKRDRLLGTSKAFTDDAAELHAKLCKRLSLVRRN